MENKIKELIKEIQNQLNQETNEQQINEIQEKIYQQLIQIMNEMSQRTTHHKQKQIMRKTHFLEYIKLFLDKYPKEVNQILLSNCYHFKRYPITQTFITMNENELKEIQLKIHNTKKLNNSYGKSKDEDRIFELLLKKFSNTKRQRTLLVRYPAF